MKRGRKTIDKDALTENITVRFSKNEIEEIKKIAENIEIPTTRLIRNLVLCSLDDAKFLNKIGVLKGTKKLIEFKKRLQNEEKYPRLITS